ncbi:MAG: DUF2070 family protein [Candidatus Bathyarchaeia archaeon]
MHGRSYLFSVKMLPYYRLVRAVAFPSMSRILTLLFTFTIGGSALAFTFSRPTLDVASYGGFFGLFVFFIPSVLTDLFSALVLLRGDPLFYLRRCLALSLFSCTLWTIILGLGGLLSNHLVGMVFPTKPLYLALFTVIPIRTLAVLSMSSKRILSKITYSFLQPLASIWASTLLITPMRPPIPILTLVICISLLPTMHFLSIIESRGKRAIGTSPLRIFRAFLRDWLNGDSEMFEEYLEDMGVDDWIRLTVIQFRSKRTGQLRGLLVVGNFHPGPFLNVGSSTLPYIIKRSLEVEEGLVVAVPHGVSGHEHNLVSKIQNEKILSTIKELMRVPEFHDNASKFQRFTIGSAKVGAQIFGDSILLTLTQSPRDMEDIPSSLGEELERYARMKFKHVAIIDAHNSINNVRSFTGWEVDDFRSASIQAIESLSTTETSTFEMGVAKSEFEGFGPEHGCGPGGISVFIFKVSGMLTAYIILDGNNMVSGLREKVLSSIKTIGIDDGEVMTTDTHIVNGLVPARLGYYPVGEAIDQELILEMIRKTVERAKRDLEAVTVSSASGGVEVRSLGSKSLEQLTNFMYSVSRLVAGYIVAILLASNTLGLLLV